MFIEVYDEDAKVIEMLARIHGCDVKTAVNDLVNIGCPTYREHIVEWKIEQQEKCG